MAFGDDRAQRNHASHLRYAVNPRQTFCSCFGIVERDSHRRASARNRRTSEEFRMISIELDLPFLIPLDPGAYTMNMGSFEVVMNHEFVDNNSADPRVGSATGSFSFVRDPCGLAGYSKLSLDLSEGDLDFLLQVPRISTVNKDQMSAFEIPEPRRTARVQYVLGKVSLCSSFDRCASRIAVGPCPANPALRHYIGDDEALRRRIHPTQDRSQPQLLCQRCSTN